LENTLKLVSRFRTWADTMQPKIDNLGRPFSQNPTPKRNKEYQSKLHDCRNMESLQKALRALADAHEDGSIHETLTALRTKDEIGSMVRKYTTGGGGYYSVIEADDYADTSDAARLLQGMIEGNSQERAESERLRKIGTLEAEIKLSTIPGFFPTPSAVVDLMLEQAHIETGMHVLEPSAGSGNIADAIRRDHPGAFIDVCEVNLRLRELLELKGHRLIASDFLEFKAGTYERILMNPPFELLNDCKHVRHAYDLLADRGVLVSIMSPSFEFRNDRKSTEFREWLGTVKATWETLPDGSFKSSGTGVSTRLLVIDK
jgi:hypothetical protein